MGLGKTYSADYLIDSNGNTGVSGQVLISTATGIDWADGSAITGGPYLPLAGGTMTGTAGVIFPDNFKLNFGTGSDLQIFHNGSNSYIRDNGTGGLVLEGSTMLELKARSGETYLRGNENSSVQLYHNNNLKLNTTSTGVEVTGKITNLTAGTGNLDAVNVQQLNDATTGALIFKGTWSAASTTTSTTSAAVSSSTTVVISSSNAGISVGATVTGAALPAGVTVTAIAADEVTLTISSAQSITSGATLTFTTVGGIPDLSQTARKVTGDYYICETAGVAAPNGTGTAPDEWAVGDWVAFSDLATDAWQKIDNSSVLSGAGTGGTVPIWAGSGTSVTLADAPITVSGSDTTFAGIVNATNIITINSVATGNPYLDFKQGGTQKAYIQYSDTGDNLVLQSDGQMSFKTSGNTDALTIDTSQNATFAGDVTATANYSAGNSKIIYKAQRSGGAVAGDWSYDDATTDMSLGTSTAHSFSLKTGNTRALTFRYSSQNATFAGDVTVGALTSGATAQLVINHEGGSGAVAKFMSRTNRAFIQVGDNDTNGYIVAEGDLLSIGRAASASSNNININASNNVGIGTTSPSTILDVRGAGATSNPATSGSTVSTGTRFRIASSTTATAVLDFGISTSGKTWLQSTDRADLSTEYPLLLNPNGGNVGIGTTDPGYKLHVDDNTAYGGVLIEGDNAPGLSIRDNSGTSLSKIYVQSTASSQGNLRISSDDNNTATTPTIEFIIGGSHKMRVLDNGNVGIGTTDPVRRLDVDSAATSDIARFGNNSGNFTLGQTTNLTSLDLAANNAYRIRQGSTVPFYVKSDGNVGIGTTNPSAKLDIYGDSNSGDNMIELINSKYDSTNTTGETGILFGWNNHVAARITAFKEGTVNRTGFKIVGEAGFNVPATIATFRSTGKVGIGTTDPASKLHLSTTGSSTLTIQNTTNSGNATLNFRDEGNNDQYSIYYALGANRAYNLVNGNGLTVYSSQTSGEIARFGMGTGYTDSYFTGNVGINTTSPGAKLDVNSGISTSSADVIKLSQATNGAIKAAASLGISIQNGGESTNAADLWFTTATGGSLSERMRISSDGAIKFNAYGAGFLQTDANGNITAGSVTTSDTLDDVTDNGNSTTNSIVLGASTVNGTMLVGGSYTSGNIVVIGGMKSSGGAMIGYAVKPDTANNHGFVSSSAFTLERSAYYQQGNRHRWYAGASQDVAIGNAVSISETMRLDFDKLGLSTTNPATLLHLGKATNGTNIISLGEASIGGPHGLDFYGDDATRTKKFSIYYRTGTENISMETSNGAKRFEINQNGGVTFNEAFTFPTADGSAGAALVTNGSGALSWGGGYQQYTPVGWTILNNQTYTSTGANISSSSTQAQAGTTPVQRNSATEFEATKAGWYEISYSFIVKNNYTNRAMIGAYMTVSTSGGGGVISGSHSTQYVRYSTYGEYAQIQNTFYYYTSYSSTDFYLLAYLLSGSMNMTTQSISQSMISFRYINNDIT